MIAGGGIRFFQITIAALGGVEGWRAFSGPYPFRLVTSAGTWGLDEGQASRLAIGARQARARFREAEIRRRPTRPGRCGVALLHQTDLDLITLEVGVTDRDAALYMRFAEAPPIVLSIGDSAMLLAAFAEFGAQLALTRQTVQHNPSPIDYRGDGPGKFWR
jgi:hypothetical protein